MSDRYRSRPRHWVIVLAAITLVIALAALVGCGSSTPPSPPDGAHGRVVDRELITRHEWRTVPRTTQACSTTNGTRSCRKITVGTKRERRTVVECRRFTLHTGRKHCVSASLYAATEVGDRW